MKMKLTFLKILLALFLLSSAPIIEVSTVSAKGKKTVTVKKHKKKDGTTVKSHKRSKPSKK